MSSAPRLPPDAIIQKRVASDEKHAALDRYTHEMKKAAMAASWFENKSKYDFTDNQKRNDVSQRSSAVPTSSCCSGGGIGLNDCSYTEVTSRESPVRYESEARSYEEELHARGLAIQRDHV